MFSNHPHINRRKKTNQSYQHHLADIGVLAEMTCIADEGYQHKQRHLVHHMYLLIK